MHVLQGTEMIDHLDSVMADKSIEVVSGHQYVEVKPKGISKGAMVRRILDECHPDFVLCLGDDKSDEEMFRALKDLGAADTTFPCTVGQKPSFARYYVNDYASVLTLLWQLASV
jgi:trehalose 6-phosphate synthase/phosphatase